MFGFYYKKIIIFFAILFVSFFFLPNISLFAAELNSTNYTITNSGFGVGNQMDSTNFSLTGSLSDDSFGVWSSNNIPLVPGTITSCGKIVNSGTYTLSVNLSGISGSCFIILANNVTIDGGGHTITAVQNNPNYAVVATSSVSGGSGYGLTTIQNINFANFAGGVNANGNNNVGNTGGNGGDVLIASSTIGNITSAGGNGGTGGTISFSGVNINLSNKTYTANNLSLTYSETLTTTNTQLSALSNLIINSTNLGSYIGGSFPIIPGTIHNCGTIYFAGIYNLGENISGNCNISHTRVTIDGAGNTLVGNITANGYGVTLSDIVVTGLVSTTGGAAGDVVVNNSSNINSLNVTGLVTGDGSSSIGYTVINAGATVATSSVSFVSDVLNNGTIYSGNLVEGKIINNAIIHGNFTFNASSTNLGTVNGNATLNSSSTNTGTITGTAIFNMFTANAGAVNFNGSTTFNGTGYINGNIYDFANSQITSWVFNDTCANAGIIKGDAVFNGTSTNAISGTVQGNAIFNNSSKNLGTVIGDSHVNYPVTRPLTGTTNGQVNYYGYPGLYYNDSATGHGVVGKWDDILNWWTDPASTIHAPVIPTAGDDVIIVSGNITASSITAVVNTAIFQGNSNNSIHLYLSGTSTSAALFNDSSTNSGTIHGNATFTGEYTDSTGTVTGYITRQYNAGVYVVVKDFTHNGVAWIIQAINGASVDLSAATYSFLLNTFQALNNGFFSAWNSLIGSGSQANPILSISSPTTGTNVKWQPNVSWGTETLCQYKVDNGNYTSVDCSKNGSDIVRPSAGSHTLFLKSTDLHNNITEKTVLFAYDNTQPIDTDCSQPLDEVSRPYYYLIADVASCSATVSTKLRGDDNGGGHFYTVGNIAGSSTNIILENVTATGTISAFNNITVASSSLLGTISVVGKFNSDNISRFGNTTIESGGVVYGGTFVGNLLNKSGGTIENNVVTPVTVALNTTNNGTITGGFIFNASSTNFNIVTGSTIFNGTSVNNGTVNGDVTLKDSSLNSGTVNGDIKFDMLAATSNAVTFFGTSIFRGTGVLSGSSKDYQGDAITRWIFNDASTNAGYTKGDSFFNGYSTNIGTVQGQGYFSDSSTNTGVVTGTSNIYYSVAIPLGGTLGSLVYHSYPNSFSFQNISGDYKWNNVSNWFTDTTLTTPLGRIPNSNENVVLFASTTLTSNITNNVFIGVSSSTLNGSGYTLNGNVSGDGAYGGNDAYSFNLVNITVTGTTTANGGNGTPDIDGGNGGVINVATSSTGAIVVNGGDPEHNGGDAGAATVVNSYAYQDNVKILAVGGDSSGCGYGGSGGNITLIDSSGYDLVVGTGADAILTIAQGGHCENPPAAPTNRVYGQISRVGIYRAPSNPVTEPVNPPSRSAMGSSINRPYDPFAQALSLAVQRVKELVLKPLPVFGDDQNLKGTFSFASSITNFIFAPKITSSPLLKTFLDEHKITNAQDLARLNVSPMKLTYPAKIGLFTVTTISKKPAKSTKLETFLSSDIKYKLIQLVKVFAKEQITVSLDGEKVGKFNGEPINFTRGFVTITAPEKAGRYYLTSSNSAAPLALDVKVANVTSPQNIEKTPSIVKKIVNWFKSWF